MHATRATHRNAFKPVRFHKSQPPRDLYLTPSPMPGSPAFFQTFPGFSFPFLGWPIVAPSSSFAKLQIDPTRPMYLPPKAEAYYWDGAKYALPSPPSPASPAVACSYAYAQEPLQAFVAADAELFEEEEAELTELWEKDERLRAWASVWE